MERRPLTSGDERGFSLIEALVMLAVAGMALMLIFTVASRAGQDGFRLGRKALDAADAEVVDDTLRTLVSGLMLAPTPAPSAGSAGSAFDGGPEGFAGPAILSRATACGPAGPAGVLRLGLRRQGGGDRLVCRTGGAEVELADLGAPAAFAYSTDGISWVSAWSDHPSIAPREDGPSRSQAVFIRLATKDGRFEVIAATPRERPAPDVRPVQGPAQ